VSDAPHRLLPFARARRTVVGALEVGARRHMVHALVELDVTEPRRRLRAHRERTGEALSFTAFVVGCLASAIDADRRLHAYRDWRGRLVLFEDVDVVTLVEPEAGQVAIPHILRAANRRSLRQLHDELRAVQARPAASAQRSGVLARLAGWVPGPLLRLTLRALGRAPHWLKRTSGTTVVTSVGMFGGGAGWGIGIVPLHTLALVLGGISRKPGVVGDRIEVREYLALTVSVDHDLVDGAPAARFVEALRVLVEGGHGLEQGPEAPPPRALTGP
jgi:pyruvate/2-oxoglutarate dehydrogenase complex dihydrolipoamide acyltransferase (E2) component